MVVPSPLERQEGTRNSARVTLEWLDQKLQGHAINPLLEATVDMYLEMVSEAQAKVKDTFEKIVALHPADMTPHNLEYFNLIDMVPILVNGLTAIKNAFPAPLAAAGGHGAAAGPHPGPGNMRLPRLELPTFDGNIQSWQSFHDMFRATVHSNTHISNAQKFTYLKSLLKGEALNQIKCVPLTDDNFDTAWAQLTHRYNNERELLYSVLRRFHGQPKLLGNSATALRSFIDVNKLDTTTREMWEHTLKDSSIPPLKDLLEFLEQRSRALASGDGSQDKPMHQANHGKPGFAPPKQVAHAHHAVTTPSCNLCKEAHWLSKCPKFLAMPVTERNDAAKKNSLCFNCLQVGHSLPKCLSRGTCRTCHRKHHTLLHRDKPPKDNAELVLNNHLQSTLQSQGMLATAVIKVRDHHGQLHHCRAFLDGGSTVSFITDACVRRLKLSWSAVSAEIRGLASTSLATAKGLATLTIHSQYPGNPTHSVQALILSRVTANLPIHPCDPSKWPHLKDLQLADPKFYQPDKIDILLGADIFYDIFLNEKRTGPSGCPHAIKTTLGWLVAGRMKSSRTEVAVHYSDIDMEKQLQKLWEIETVSSGRTMTTEERDCETHFQSTHQINEHGRFVVKLPFKTPLPALGSTREIAIRRLKQLEGRFPRAPDRQQQYREFMQQYLALGHMEEIPANEIHTDNTQVCYIPHHFVLKESSTTTKFRVVFDASAKTSNGLALNDALMVGPTIQDNMSDILMRFRTHPIAFTADVAKMYRQILVDRSQVNFQRIVWRDLPSEPIKDYRLLTVTYGTGPAPFLATRALQQLATNHSKSLPLASQTAMKDMYVDDLLSGTKTKDKANETVQQLMHLMSNGGMELRKWSSNCQELLMEIPPELCETQPLLPLDTDQTIKALGVYWDPIRDITSYKVNLHSTYKGKQLTKRNLLSEISTIFDPLGWISPVIIKARILFQQLWKLSISWDETVPEQVQVEWIAFRDNLHYLELLAIPRCIIPAGQTFTKLVGFCDASEKAYAAVAYVCVYKHGEEPVVSLITSKTRVAPAKTVSLPRLELCGAVLLSQVIKNVQNNLGITASDTSLWTDSTVVLAWIQAPPSKWKTFVANRVTEIQERAPDCQWNHVSGTDNPADCASRGLDPSEIQTHPLSWHGPSWLASGAIPNSNFTSDLDLAAVKLEEKSTVVCFHLTQPDNPMIREYSSLWKLQRITAFIIRFYSNCLIKINAKKRVFPCQLPQCGPISPNELTNALFTWIKLVQAEAFYRKIHSLQHKLPVHAKSSIRALNPFLDYGNILRAVF